MQSMRLELSKIYKSIESKPEISLTKTDTIEDIFLAEW